jgi:SAM-dependent methyltransferase
MEGTAMSTTIMAHEEHARMPIAVDTPAVTRTTSELVQRDHYDTIAAEYEIHYSDKWSSEYRRRFIYEPMFDGLDLRGTNVLDAMCGSGQTTAFLLKRNASVTGLDISGEVLATFRRQFPDSKAEQRSLLSSGFADNSFDFVAIVGGLHHIHPDLKAAVNEIHRVLKPGGYFCFMEPHSGSLPDVIRKVWYRHDRFFSDNEAAIDLARMENDFGEKFAVKKTRYLGNVAFLLVLNSLIFRVPPTLKRFYSPLLFPLESVLMKLQTKLTSCFAVAQWQKR